MINLKQMRLDQGVRQEELCRRAKVALRSLQYYETGRRPPNVNAAIRLADALGTKTYEEFKELFSLLEKRKSNE